MATFFPPLVEEKFQPVYDPANLVAKRQALQSGALQNQQRQQALSSGAQDLQLGAEKLQGAKYLNQETATQIAEQQVLLQAYNEEKAARLAALNPSAPSGVPAVPSAPLKTAEGLIVRDPAAGRPAGAADQILPGVVGVAPSSPNGTPVPTSSPSFPPATNTTIPSTSLMDGALSRAEGKIRPSTMMTYQAQLLGTKEKLATIQKTTADAAEANQKVQDAHADALGALFQPVKDSGYSLSAMQFALLHMRDSGFGPEADRISQMMQANPDNIRPLVDSFLAQTSAARVTANARKLTADTGAEKQSREGPGQQAASAQAIRSGLAQQLLSAPDAGTYYRLLATVPRDQRALLPDFDDPSRVSQLRQYAMTPEQQTTAAATAARDANTAANEAAARRQRDVALGLESQGLKIRRVEADPLGTLGLNPNPPAFAAPGPDGQPLTGNAFLGTLSPPMAATVKAIAEGRQTNLPRGKELGPLMAAVNQYDPTYSATRGKTRAAFTTGTQGRNIQALNTAAVHVDQLSQASDAMNNGPLPVGNQLYNAIATAFGREATTNFEALKTAVAGEMATALKGSATDQEIHQITNTLKAANSPAQLAGIARTNLHVLGAKLNTYDEQYHQQMPDDPWSPVLPSAQAVFTKNGIKPLASQNTSAPKKNPFR